MLPPPKIFFSCPLLEKDDLLPCKWWCSQLPPRQSLETTGLLHCLFQDLADVTDRCCNLGLVLLHNFSIFNSPKNKITLHNVYLEISEQNLQNFTIDSSGCRDQVRVQVLALACHLTITPWSYSRRQSKVLTAKSMAKPSTGFFWGSCSCCRPWPVSFQVSKKCYHSCNTELTQESKRLSCL